MEGNLKLAPLWKNFKLKLKENQLNDLMLTAISTNKPDFVEIFIENDCDISKFLIYEQLLKLYNDVKIDIIFLFFFNFFRKKDAEKMCFTQAANSD